MPDRDAATVPSGQHPATYSVWIWLAENAARLGEQKVERIETLLRKLSTNLWELDRSGR